MRPGSATLPSHTFRVVYAALIRIILLRLDSIGPIIMINFAIVLKVRRARRRGGARRRSSDPRGRG